MNARHLTMGAFNAVEAIRRYGMENPNVGTADIVALIKRVDADYLNVDYEAGLEIHDLLPGEVNFADPVIGYRETLSFLILHHRPDWCGLFRLGRKHVSNGLGRDELQCFKSAGLMGDANSSDVVSWWDKLSNFFFASKSEQMHSQGRDAERLSYEYECNRVKALGISEEPYWIAIDDNTAGHDILSYDLVEGRAIKKMIEVKSSTANPPVATITRNEWAAALRAPDMFCFHFWDMRTKSFFERRAPSMTEHIPMNQGGGSWRSTEISFKSLRSQGGQN